ncbi:MAG: exodeoxyribonuclease III [Proteobacteria bacterium]|nr:exodeoxyribonuclease III [Pseudomonadota bacterium]MBU1716876.1 exodeoxyribonuclease III [Pseudomonadota bacterium]
MKNNPPLNFDIHQAFTILAKEVETYQVPVIDLMAAQSTDPYRILIATILSARTKDEVTAKAAGRLFKQAPSLESLALLPEEKIAKLIYPVGFYKTKARHLSSLPGQLADLYNSQIPDTVESLIKLPGVGRKTANLVVCLAFNKPAICVDTHVHRITNIWGYVQTSTPLQTEMALREKLPTQYWARINSILVAFGQGTCRPLRPHCDRCIINNLCPKIGVTARRLPDKSTSPDSSRPKKLISWNVNGIRAIEKKGFTEIVNELNPDILALQEIKAQPDQLSDQLLNLAGYQSYWLPAEKKGYSGVCIYTKTKPIRVIYGLGEDVADREGRVLTLEFDNYYFINTYFPNAQHGLKRLEFKLDFNRHILNFCQNLFPKKSVLITGDFNVAHQPIDLENPDNNEKNPGFSPPERAWMDDFIKAGYQDTFRMYNQQPGQYTWWSYRFNARARNIGWRIDYFFIDQNSKSRVKSADILSSIMGSDHCPVQIIFK